MKLKTVALLFLCAAGMAQAGTFTVTNFQSANSNLVLAADGTTPLPAGGFVGIGFLTIEEGAINALMTGSDLAAGFTQFSNSISVGLGGNPGLYQGTIGAAIDVGSTFDGPPVYTIIGNAATLQSSTEALVFAHTGLNFQNDGASPGGNAILDVDLGRIVYGAETTGPELGTIPAGNPALQLGALIPEPSSALLGLVGLGFIGFRRRR